MLAGLLIVALSTAGCYEHRPGNPVDQYHYDHVITVDPDYAHFNVKTYINRTHLKVGLRFEDLFDGDRDGRLSTPGMDRVQITDYMSVEDPPEAAERRVGEIRNYDEMFQRVIEAAKAGRERIVLDDRDYEIRILSEKLDSGTGRALT